MKTNELPLRDRIVAHLKDTGEATAAAITKSVGMADTPSRVIKELNAMRADAVVEAERKGKGPDLSYWLAIAQAPLPQAPLPAGIRAGTRAAQIWQALPEHGQRPMRAREIVAATGVARETIAPALTGMVKARQVHRISDGLEYAYTRLPIGEAATCKEGLQLAQAAEPHSKSGQPQPEVGQNTGSAGSAAPTPVSSAEARAVPAPAPGCATPSASPAAEDELEDETTGVTDPTAADHQLLEQAVEIQDLKKERDTAVAMLEKVHALLAERVCGNVDPADLDEVECADKAADMIDDAVDEISELQRRAQAQDQALQQQTALVAEQRRALQASTELLTDKDAELQQQAGLIAELRDRHDATLAAHAEEVVDLRTRLDAALIARGDSPLNPDDEDPSVDILQVAKAWHIVAKGYRDLTAEEIALMNEIKSKGEELRQLVDKVRTVAESAPQEPSAREGDHPEYWVRSADSSFRHGLMQLIRAVARPASY